MDPRDDRMTMRKNNEEVHRRKHKMEAQAICLDVTKAFGECARRQGMMVVFNCRKENAASEFSFAPRRLVPSFSGFTVSSTSFIR
jgi:hypothetical protein